MSSLHAQINAPRPHILGIAHVAFRASDVARTETFYASTLGFEEPFSLKDDTGKVNTAVIKVNELQYVEVLPGDAQTKGQLDHFAFYTSDLNAMRSYLLARGLTPFRDIHVGRVGNPFLSVRDPDGHLIEILQYSPNSLTSQSRGKFMPAGRVSDHITHVGILVSSLPAAVKFYRDTLGFREIARPGTDAKLNGLALQASEGSDYIELIQFSGAPSANLKSQNHFGLASSDVRKTVASLQGRVAAGSRMTMQTDGAQPSASLFDPDGARIEITSPLPSIMSPNPHPANESH